MRRLALAGSAVSVALVLTACNPGDFSDLQDQTWVDSVARPGDLHASGFGSSVVFAGSTGPADGTRVAVVSQAAPAVVLLVYDASGGVKTQFAPLEQSLMSADSLASRPAFASDPAGLSASSGNLAVGDSASGSGYAVMFSGQTLEPGTLFDFGTGAAPRGLSFGKTDVDQDTQGLSNTDLVAVFDDRVALVQDYQSAAATGAPTCSLNGGKNVVVADLVPAQPGAEVAVATPSQLVVLRGSDVVAGNCTAAGIPVTAAGFGASMVAGTFGLAVGAPDANQVLVFSPDDLSNPEVIDGPTGSLRFGASVAAGDLDGDGLDELIVGDSQFSGRVKAGGIVYIMPDGDASNPVALFDESGGSAQHLGTSLAVSSFGGGNILSIGANEKVFTYFQVPLAGSKDLRQ